MGIGKISEGGEEFFLGGSGRVACREASCGAWHSNAIVRGVRGHAPPNFFLKIVRFGAFWSIFS